MYNWSDPCYDATKGCQKVLDEKKTSSRINVQCLTLDDLL